MLLLILILVAISSIVCARQWKNNYEKGLHGNMAARKEAEFYRACTLILLLLFSITAGYTLTVDINTVVARSLASFGSAIICAALTMAIKSWLKLDFKFLMNKAFSVSQVVLSLLLFLSATFIIETIVLTVTHFVPIKEALEKFFK